MPVFRDLATAHFAGPTVLTIGTFDGVHLGHQDLLRQLKETAARHQASTAVIAFHPRPKAVLAPYPAGNDYLTTPEERIALFEEMGLDVIVVPPFTRELSQKSAYDFVKPIVESLGVVGLCVGYDFALGKGREGNVKKLTELGEIFGYTLTKVEPFLLDGAVVSSTQIRNHLLDGDVRRAAYLLGRYPLLISQIIKGAQRGRTIGFPTANFAVPSERLLPANGVYATFIRALGSEQRHPSVTNVGLRPSFNGQGRTVESHILDFDQDIYGQTFILEFVEHLRPEQKFDGVDQLVAQISQDAAQAQALLADEISSLA